MDNIVIVSVASGCLIFVCLCIGLGIGVPRAIKKQKEIRRLQKLVDEEKNQAEQLTMAMEGNAEGVAPKKEMEAVATTVVGPKDVQQPVSPIKQPQILRAVPQPNPHFPPKAGISGPYSSQQRRPLPQQQRQPLQRPQQRPLSQPQIRGPMVQRRPLSQPQIRGPMVQRRPGNNPGFPPAGGSQQGGRQPTTAFTPNHPHR